MVGLFLICLLSGFSNKETVSNDRVASVYETQLKKNDSANDWQHRLEIISNDLKNSHCTTPRRNIQQSGCNHYSNVLTHVLRNMYAIRMKEARQLQKVSECLNDCQELIYNTLLCRMKYHVYALRKIII